MAGEANDVNGANEADDPTIRQSQKANEAEANDANDEAEADEANEVDEVDEANEVDKANKVNEVDEANKAIVIATNEAEDAIEANKATETEILGADDEANVIAKAAEANEAHVIVEVIALEKAVDALIKLGELCLTVVILILVFSLTKYSVTFTEVEGDFGKINNQLGTVEIAESVEIWSKSCSLRD